MSSTVSIAGLGVLLAALAVASPAAAATAIQGTVFQRASSVFNDDPSRTEGRSDFFNGAPRDLTVAARSDTVGGPRKDNSVTAKSLIRAHWNSADSGSMDIDHDWTIAGGPDLEAQFVHIELNTTAGIPRADWSYRFAATADGTFDLTGLFTGGGTDDLGLGDWSIGFAEDDGPLQIRSLHENLAVGATDPVSFHAGVTAGHSYQVALLSNEFMTSFFFTRPTVADETIHLDWSINSAASAAPEPATWAMLIVGFGLSGETLRRRARPPLPSLG